MKQFKTILTILSILVFVVIAAFGVSYFLETQKNVDPEGSKAAIPCVEDTDCGGGYICSGGFCSSADCENEGSQCGSGVTCCGALECLPLSSSSLYSCQQPNGKSRTNCQGDNSVCNTNEVCDTRNTPNICSSNALAACYQLPAGKTVSCLDISINNKQCIFQNKADGTSCPYIGVNNATCISGKCTAPTPTPPDQTCENEGSQCGSGVTCCSGLSCLPLNGSATLYSCQIANTKTINNCQGDSTICPSNAVCDTEVSPNVCSSDTAKMCKNYPANTTTTCLDIQIQSQQCKYTNKADGTACYLPNTASATCVAGKCTARTAIVGCNQQCYGDNDCIAGLSCMVVSLDTKKCRNPQNFSSETCASPKSTTNCQGDNSVCTTSQRCDTTVTPNICSSDITKVCTQIPSGKSASCLNITITNQACDYSASKADGTTCGTNQICQAGACVNIPTINYSTVKGLNLKVKLANRAEKSGYTYPTTFIGVWRDTGTKTMLEYKIVGLTGNTTYNDAAFLTANGTATYTLLDTDYIIIKPEGYLSKAYQIKNITIENNVMKITDTTAYEGGDTILDIGSFDTVNILDRAFYKTFFGRDSAYDYYYLDYNGDTIVNILDGSLQNKSEGKSGATKNFEAAINPMRTALETHLFKSIKK
jgi:hypothetical protein